MTRRPTAPLLASLALGVAACYGPLPAADGPPATAPPGLPGAEEPPSQPAPLLGDPGRVTLHRLNRAEYDNTVRDLLGVTLRPAQDFPPDDPGHGFDNNADVLTVSPLLLELYDRAAATLVREALREPLLEPVVISVEAESADEVSGVRAPDSALLLGADGRVAHTVAIPRPETYLLSVRAWRPPESEGVPRLVLQAGPDELAELEVSATPEAPATYTVKAPLEEGLLRLAVELVNGTALGAGPLTAVVVDRLRVEGPVGFEPPAPGAVSSRDRLLVCDPAEAGEEPCVREILEGFLVRAWRRPPDPEDVDGLLPLFAEGRAEGLAFEEALALPLRAALVSPRFLFRVEIDPDPTSPEAWPLDGFELASRLSYFLWSSMPDDALLTAAAHGRLADPEAVVAEAMRMLDDPRAEALVDGFVGQWLYTRAVDELAPDAWTFPDFDDALRASMRGETERFFRAFLAENRPIPELLTAPDTFVDARLAAHYGIPWSPATEGFVRIDGAPYGRGGLLKQASLLAVLSYPARTSPVRRGKWVLEQLLCAPPDPPPPGVEGLIEADADAQTLRERLAEHRKNPLCAGCHDAMDPIGLGLERYDAVGARRYEDAGFRVDTTGELWGGRPFDGADELSALLAEDPDMAACVAEKLYVYALGRGTTWADRPHLAAVTDALAARDGGLRDLVALIVASEPFRLRRGEPEEDE